MEILKKAFAKFMDEEVAKGRGSACTEDEVMVDANAALHEIRKEKNAHD